MRRHVDSHNLDGGAPLTIMLLRIFSIAVFVLGNLGIISTYCLTNEEVYFTKLAISVGFFCLGFGGLMMDIRQYRGGAATIIGALFSFFAWIGIVSSIETYIRYQQYDSGALILNSALIVAAICLFLQGYKGHRMQLAINARQKKS